jgi:hypothetical protein
VRTSSGSRSCRLFWLLRIVLNREGRRRSDSGGPFRVRRHSALYKPAGNATEYGTMRRPASISSGHSLFCVGS